MEQKNPNLTEDEKKVLFERGTEAPGTGKFLNENAKGMYVCKNCGIELFSSDAKFDSTAPGLAGWPAFSEAKNIELRTDDSGGMHRTEVVCKNCGAHLGHFFEDAPDASEHGGKHYCINSVCLDLKKETE